jgi:hypothetical protein
LILRISLSAVLIAGRALGDSYDSAIARAVTSRDRALETGSLADWEETLELFAAAVQLKASKEAEFEFASAASQLHLADEAYAAYEKALALGLAGRAATQAHSFVEAHAGEMARLEIDGPPAARVYIRRRQRAVLPLAFPLVVSAGVLHVRIEAPELPVWDTDISLQAGETKLLKPDIRPRAEPGLDRARGANEPSQGGRSSWATPALVAGGALAVGGAAVIVVTTSMLASERRSLAKNCVTLDGDECRNTTPDKRESAQSSANEIATLRNVRWVAIGGAAVGALTAALGTWRILQDGPRQSSNGSMWFAVSGREVSVNWRTDF